MTREAEALEHAGKTALAIVDAIGLLDMVTQLAHAHGAQPIALRLTSAQDTGFERCLLTRSELFRAVSARTIVQTMRDLSIEALDNIVNGLTLHIHQPNGRHTDADSRQ